MAQFSVGDNTSGTTWLRETVDRRLLAEVREVLLEPGAIAELQAEVRVQLASQARENDAAGEGARRRLQAVQGEIERLVDAVAATGLSTALAGRLQAGEAERDSLQTQIAARTPARRNQRVDDVAARYRRMVMQLQAALDDESLDRQRTRLILAEILGNSPTRAVLASRVGCKQHVT